MKDRLCCYHPHKLLRGDKARRLPKNAVVLRDAQSGPGPGAVRGAAFRRLKNAEAVLRSYEAVASLKEGGQASLARESVAELAVEGLWALEELYGGSSRTGPVQEVPTGSTLDCC